MNPILSWLAGQGVDVAAEQTGAKPYVRGLLSDVADFFIPSAQASSSEAIGTNPDFTPRMPSVATPPIMQQENQTPDVFLPSPDWTGPGRGKALEIDQESMNAAQKLRDLGAKSMSEVGQKAANEAKNASDPNKEENDVPQGGFFDTIKNYLGDKEKMARVALAFNSLRQKPSKELAEMLQGRIQGFEMQRTANRTADWLESRGMAQQAEIIRQNPSLAAEILKSQVGTTAAFQTLESRARAAGLAPGTPEYQNFMRTGGQSFAGGLQVGSIPAGYQLVEREGGVRLEPIPGGEAERKQKLAEEQKVGQRQLEQRAGNVVMQDIGRLRDLVEQDPVLNPVLGVTGLVASVVPGSNRINAESLAQTIRSNVGFDRLQQMREASPTGGALGQVSDRELSTLQAVLGNLSLSQSQEQLLYNLDRLKEIYSGILNKAAAYPNASEFGFSGEMPSGEAGGDPLGLGV